MASIGKCTKCSKTVYQIEGLVVAKKAYHKGCFKCDVCNWQLSLQNFKNYNDKVYCPNHYPVIMSMGPKVFTSDPPPSSVPSPQCPLLGALPPPCTPSVHCRICCTSKSS